MEEYIIGGAIILIAGIIHVRRVIAIRAQVKKLTAHLEEEVDTRTRELILEKERVLKINEELERISMVASRVNSAVIITDKEGITEWVNDGFSRITGYNREEVLGKRLGPLLHGPITSREIVKNMEERTMRGEAFSAELAKYHKDGRLIWMHVERTPIFNRYGEVDKYISIEMEITEKLALHETLLHKTHELDSILNSIDDCVWSFSIREGRLIFLNPANERVFGRPVEEFYNNPSLWQEVIHPDDRMDQEKYDRVFTTGSGHFQHRIIRPDGEIRWLDNKIQLIRDTEGQPLRLDGITVDITDRKKVEEAMLSSREYYRLMFEENPLPMVIFNPDTRIFKAVNQAAVNHYGYSKEEFLTMTLGDLRIENHPGFRDSEICDYREGEEFQLHVIHRKKNGEAIEVEVKARRLSLDGETVALAMFNDITERLRAERAIKKNELNLNALINNSNDAVGSIDMEGRLITFNKEFADVYSNLYKVTPVPGMVIFENFSREEVEYTIPIFNKVMAGERTSYEREFTINGANRTYEFFVSPILSEDNSVKGATFFGRDITERKNAGEMIRGSEEKYRYMFENNPLPIWVLDLPNYCFLAVNEAAIEHYGYSREEFLSMNLIDIIHPDFRYNLELKKAGYTIPGSHTIITKHLKKDGREMVIELTSHPMPYQGKQARLVLLNDITQRSLIEEAIHSSEANLKAVIENTRDSIWSISRDGRLTTVNNNYKKYFLKKYGVEVSPGMEVFNCLTEEERESNLQTFNHVLQGNSVTFERSQWFEGKQWYLEISVNPIILEDGSISGATYFSRDITERKENEISIRNSEERYTRLMETMNDGLLYMDENNNIVYANDRFYDLVGYDHDELKNSPALEILLDEENARMVHEKNKLRRNGVADQYEVKMRRKTGEIIYGIVKGSPLLDEEGRYLGSLALFTDITQRKNSENQIRAVNKELDQFAYIVSHDLKAPLRAINNLAHWIEEDLEDKMNEEVRQNMNLLRGRVVRMESLINGILEYSRAGRRLEEVEDVNVAELLGEVMELIAIPSHMKITIEGGMPVLKAEKIKLHQVFSNLLSNAIKYHDKPLGNIYISVLRHGSFYEFAVRDDGPGIDPQYHDKIFVIFQTLQPRDQVESTGVGLAIVKKIINEAGGTIRVQSARGEGTCFYFTWPGPLTPESAQVPATAAALL